MKPVKEIVAMVIDSGLFVELAVHLAKTYKKVYYCKPDYSPFPKMTNKVGYGLEGIEVVDSVFFDGFNTVDLFVFPDCHFASLQVHLASLGKSVWGSRNGEELELQRAETKRIMKKMNLPVGPYDVVKGTQALRDYLKKHENVYVKIDHYRGHMETFHALNYNLVEPVINDLDQQLGAFKSVAEFIVEGNLPDKVEVGVDAWSIDGKLPTTVMTGIEIKDKGYTGRIANYKALPEQVTRWNNAMEPVFKAFNYRGFLSTEVRIGKDKVPYLIDPCCRQPAPPGDLYQEIYSNLPELIAAGAEGRIVEPIAKAQYGAELVVNSMWADKHWQPISFPPEFRNNIKIRNACRIDGKYYSIPQDCGLIQIVGVTGIGDTMDAAISMALKAAAKLEGYYLEVPEDALEDAKEQIDRISKILPTYWK